MRAINTCPVPLHPPERSDRAIAAAYNTAGDSSLTYADGDPGRLYAFDGQYAYGDRVIWETLFARLCAIRATRARSIRILDLGCGPGTWLRRVVTRARAIGSTPSVYVEALAQARRFHQDNRANRLEVEFQNGRPISLPSHLFTAAELCALVAPHMGIEDISGLDLFHGRFAGDPRWNPDCEGSARFVRQLERLEKIHCRDREFLDHATHLLLVGKRFEAKAERNRK